MILLLNELTRKNVPFKWTEQCLKSLDYFKQIITTSLILAYSDPEKQYYLFTDSNKHSWMESLYSILNKWKKMVQN